MIIIFYIQTQFLQNLFMFFVARLAFPQIVLPFYTFKAVQNCKVMELCRLNCRLSLTDFSLVSLFTVRN